MPDKGTISAIVMQQSLDNLTLAIQARNDYKINKEVQLSINIFLLLGITLEGIINEVGKTYLDTWTWDELEKASTPLKWRVVSGLRKGFDPSEKPLQTIIEIQKIRNQIAHPKVNVLGDDLIFTSNKKFITKNPVDSYKLPEENFEMFVGYEKLVKKYNARTSLAYIKDALMAIEAIKNLFEIKKGLEWSKSMFNQIKSLTVNKNEMDE